MDEVRAKMMMMQDESVGEFMKGFDNLVTQGKKADQEHIFSRLRARSLVNLDNYPLRARCDSASHFSCIIERESSLWESKIIWDQCRPSIFCKEVWRTIKGRISLNQEDPICCQSTFDSSG